MNIFWYLVIGITLTSLAYRLIGTKAISYIEGTVFLTVVVTWPVFLAIFILSWIFIACLFLIYLMAWIISKIINSLKPSSL